MLSMLLLQKLLILLMRLRVSRVSVLIGIGGESWPAWTVLVGPSAASPAERLLLSRSVRCRKSLVVRVVPVFRRATYFGLAPPVVSPTCFSCLTVALKDLKSLKPTLFLPIVSNVWFPKICTHDEENAIPYVFGRGIVVITLFI